VHGVRFYSICSIIIVVKTSEEFFLFFLLLVLCTKKLVVKSKNTSPYIHVHALIETMEQSLSPEDQQALGKKTPWDLAAELFADEKFCAFLSPTGEPENIIRLRQYRVMLQRLVHRNYPDLHMSKQKCNFWLLYGILQHCEQPFSDPEVRKLWLQVMMCMYTERYGLEQTTDESLREAIPISTHAERISFLHMNETEPGCLSPAKSDVEFWNAISYLKPTEIENFARYHHQGPRAFRMAPQTMPIDEEKFLSAELPRSGKEYSVSIAFASVSFDGDMDARNRIAHVFEPPIHLVFEES
jgi:hypothetical protein